MYILETVSSLCTDPALANILAIFKKVMNIIWIVGPILAIISSVINAIKLMTNPDEKKYKGLFKNSIMALLFLFLLPVIINAIMGLFDETFEIAACWNYAEQVSTNGKNSNYIDNDREKNDVLVDPDKYEVEDKEASKSNSSSSNVTNTGSSTTVSRVIFVGDSRTVGMQQSVSSNSNDVWSCKTSMGYDWMKSTGIPNIQNKITSGSAVVILMGVNDLYHASSYISYLNSFVSTVTSKGAKLYFVSVNPTSKSKDYLNDDIESFNAKMRQGLSSSITYIDTNTYLKNNGYASEDGLHYSSSTYKKIYNYIKSCLTV